jgi:anaerobic dimethyl sulfoxide reductase subunit B (iron-sulfur subunit)
MQLAFFVDTTACSGCKACQVACKDKHDLEVGRLWRRVATVEGGEWVRQGAAWTTTAFAYSVSLSCMHCERPACVDACPTRAMRKRDDGTVSIAAERCIGCRYCEWVCPYGAPRYDARAGRMTKCDLCADERQAGRPPACVAACPMRALEFGELRELEARHGGSAKDIYPLPDPAMTRPSLVVTAHRDAAAARSAIRPGPDPTRATDLPETRAVPRIGNREEL